MLYGIKFRGKKAPYSEAKFLDAKCYYFKSVIEAEQCAALLSRLNYSKMFTVARYC